MYSISSNRKPIEAVTMAKKKKRKLIGTEIPEVFLTRLQEMVGSSLFSQLEKTFVARPTTLRLNKIKEKKEVVLEAIRTANLQVKHVPWYADAFILQRGTKRELTDQVIYNEGKIYIQSLASMVPPIILEPKPGETVLDLTAAPGSKTSQIAMMMEKTGELVANDNNKIRFFKLKHNMEQLGVVDAEKEDWKFTLRLEHGVGLTREYENYFDKILLDAPCSAEARFVNGVPKTFGFWSERKIKEMAYKQRQLLLSAWTSLKPGGTLVYSTCTFAPEENEMQISRLLERNPDAEIIECEIPGLKKLPVLKEWKGKTFHPGVKKCLRIMPTSEIEGFFVAKIKKSL